MTSDMMIVVEASLETELPGSCTNCKGCAYDKECQQKKSTPASMKFHPEEMNIIAAYQRLLWDVQDLT